MSMLIPPTSIKRAPYQYYNVSYAENAVLIDPFRPELGRINPSAMMSRLRGQSYRN